MIIGIMARETELKLELDPTALQRLRRHPLLRALKHGRAATSHLVSVYFDTPTLALKAGRKVLRVRHQGARRLLTLKQSGALGLFQRGEWEQEIDGDLPPPDLLAQPPLAELLDGVPLDQLAPLFRTEVRRTVWMLSDGAFEIELALDQGSVTAGAHSIPLCEAELELKQGEPAALFDLALVLQETIPLRLGIAAKSDRGYGLIRPEPTGPRRGKPPALAPGMTVAEAVRGIGHACLQHLLANQAPLLAGHDPDAVHQMRVALRRLRSSFGLFRPLLAGPELDDLRGQLRWLLAALGPARDLDVFLAEILAPALPHFPTPLTVLQAHYRAERDGRYAAAAAAVADGRFTRLALGLGRWLEGGAWRQPGSPEHAALLAQPIEDYARQLLAKRLRRLGRAARHLGRLSPAERHAVRIQVKKMRYSCEFFAPLFPGKGSARMCESLAALQDSLGRLNDVAVARDILTGLAAGHPDKAFAAGLLAGWHEARVPGLLAEAVEAWQQVSKRRPFWEKG